MWVSIPNLTVFVNMDTLFAFLVIIPSVIIHEYAHGWVADQLGDKTARYAGRLTIDPRVHVDLFGTILLPLLLFMFSLPVFGYAKPVPYNPYNLKDQKWGPALVGLAGPLSNFLLAAVFAVFIRAFPGAAITPYLFQIVMINVVLLVFNLIPIPPLDGSKILYAVLPDSAREVKIFLDRYGFIIVMFFVFFLFSLLSPIINGVIKWLVF